MCAVIATAWPSSFWRPRVHLSRYDLKLLPAERIGVNSVRGSCKDGRDGAGDLPSSHRLAVISGSAMSAALCPYCSDSIAAPRPARRRSPIRRHRNETFAVRLGTRVPRSGVGGGFVISMNDTTTNSSVLYSVVLLLVLKLIVLARHMPMYTYCIRYYTPAAPDSENGAYL